MNKINLAVSDKPHSACLRHEPFDCEPFGREPRIEPLRDERLRPKVARVKGLRQIKPRLGHWSLEFGYCPSTRLRVVSLSNHLLFACPPSFWRGTWNFLYSKTRYLDIVFDCSNVFVGHNTF